MEVLPWCKEDTHHASQVILNVLSPLKIIDLRRNSDFLNGMFLSHRTQIKMDFWHILFSLFSGISSFLVCTCPLAYSLVLQLYRQFPFSVSINLAVCKFILNIKYKLDVEWILVVKQCLVWSTCRAWWYII